MPVPFWEAIFGTPGPVEVEIGPGRGDVLVAFAAADPATHFFAIEHKQAQAGAIAERAAALGLGNVRVLGGDARCLVERLIPDGSIAAYHVYFPDPWPKTRHVKRRLFTPTFVAALARTLAPIGAVHVASDLEPVYATMRAALTAGGFLRVDGAPSRPRPITKFERKYGRDQIYDGTFRRPLA